MPEALDTALALLIVAGAVWWVLRSVRRTSSCGTPSKGGRVAAIPTSKLSLGRRRVG